MPDVFELTLEQNQTLGLVNNLAQTCTHELEHAQHVTYLALRLFDELKKLHKLGAEQRFWLQCAGLLHDIGWVEGWKEHHKASLQIILTTPLLPFSSKERLIIGSIARYHRRAMPDLRHDHYKVLEPDEREVVNKLAALLRLADGLDSTHLRRIRDLKCKISKQKVIIRCAVSLMPGEEAAEALDKSDLFQLAYQRKIEFDWKKIH